MVHHYPFINLLLHHHQEPAEETAYGAPQMTPEETAAAAADAQAQAQAEEEEEAQAAAKRLEELGGVDDLMERCPMPDYFDMCVQALDASPKDANVVVSCCSRLLAFAVEDTSKARVKCG